MSILIAEIDAVLEQGRRLVREEERCRRREEEVQEEKRRRTEADGKKREGQDVSSAVAGAKVG